MEGRCHYIYWRLHKVYTGSTSHSFSVCPKRKCGAFSTLWGIWCSFRTQFSVLLEIQGRKGNRSQRRVDIIHSSCHVFYYCSGVCGHRVGDTVCFPWLLNYYGVVCNPSCSVWAKWCLSTNGDGAIRILWDCRFVNGLGFLATSSKYWSIAEGNGEQDGFQKDRKEAIGGYYD